MYKISAPLMNSTVTPANRGEYLEMLKSCEISRVFLVPSQDLSLGKLLDFEELCDNIAFFEANGIEAAIWIGETLGHGGLLHDSSGSGNKKTFTEMVNVDGEVRANIRCPLDTDFQKNLENLFKDAARTGVKLILIDDDFRLSQHGEKLCCLCELHMAKIRQLLGENISREELCEKAFSGKANKYRDAFLKANGDSLCNLARAIRSAVDEIDKSVCLAICSCYCMWDADNADPLKLTEILRGENDGVLRLHGAPYWAARGNYKLPVVMEIARMFASFCRDGKYELMNEGDAYPRPRYNIPAAHVDLHDAIMRADASSAGILKYMFDYVSSPSYEKGYVERHVRKLPLLKATKKAFDGGAQEGVQIIIKPHLLKESNLDLTEPCIQSPYPTAAIMLGSCGIPTTFTDKGMCRAVFGESIKSVDTSALGGGIFIDAIAAYTLTESGVDVGLSDSLEDMKKSFVKTKIAHISSADGKERATTVKSDCSILFANAKETATPLLYAEINGEKKLYLYRYENAKGERFLVSMLDGTFIQRDSGLFYGYLLQSALTEGIEWISGKKLPASCTGHPALYIMCKRNGDKLTVGLFNCFEDEIFTPTVTLDKSYKNIEFVNSSGKLNGNEVTLDDIAPFSFTVFTVTE